jgi:hypothetical protein
MRRAGTALPVTLLAAVTGSAVLSAALAVGSSVPALGTTLPVQVVGSVATGATAPLASDVLAGLTVKGRAAKTGYRRALYGETWTDEDGDGCWTREEILQRDLTRTTFRNTGRCRFVATGVLTDPYTGRATTFVRGPRTSTLVQIDHVVALMDSWQKGAQQLPLARREAFANDPLNLLAVAGAVNQAKGASDAASWLPPNKAFRCSYVARQVAVKRKYGLWVTAAEKNAIAAVLPSCPGQRSPT